MADIKQGLPEKGHIALSALLPEAFSKLLEAATCPICLDRLPPSIVCCDNGHAICEHCQQGQTVCPTCRVPFSTKKHVTLSNMIEALPKLCKFLGCGKIKWDISGHERACQYRPTKCRICDWTGLVKELSEHMLFENHYIYEKPLNCKFSFFTTRSKVNLNLTYYHIVNGQVLWKTIRNRPDLGSFSMQFSFIPTEEFVGSYYVTVVFKSNKLANELEIKLILNSLSKDYVEENTLVFHHDMLKGFVNPEVGSLSYHVSLVNYLAT